ncbi:MAG TPA: hypothetical protein VLQ90_05520, partial [Pyrinomonadaceae bacterium]|nr:hypothetical protein [Pyrinomonadaceae bacterium]
MPTGKPFESIDETAPSRSTSGGQCPALQISTSPFVEALPQTSVAYYGRIVVSAKIWLARS